MTSIKSKIVLFVVVMMVIFPVISALYFMREYDVQGRYLADNVDETFKVLNATIVRDLRNAMLANQISGMRASLLSMKSFKQIRSAVLLDSEGKVVIKDDGVFVQRGLRNKPSGLQAHVLQKAYQKSEIQMDVQKGPSVLLYRYLVPFKNEKECKSCHGHHEKSNGVLILSFQVPDVRSQTHHYAVFTFSFYLAGITLTSLLLLFLIQKLVVFPLRELQGAMQDVAGGNLNAQIPDCRGDEIGRVSSYFNEMVRKLQASQEELEKSIMEKERAQRLAEVGMMASRVAHEVRNPLNVLEGAAYYLRSVYGSEKDIVEQVFLIQKNVARLERFSKDLLSYAKPEELHKTNVDVLALLKEKVSEFKRLRNGKKINVHVLSSPELPEVPVDPFKMDEVFENILQNAYDAIPDGGKIVVSAKFASPFVVVSVKDNGCGFSREQMENIFKPFFTTKSGGTGLGLSIAKKIVESHGGEMTVTGTEKEGTEVIVKLPEGGMA